MISHLLSRLPAPRAADWKCWNMSICIAVLCNDRKTAVCITDEKVSFATFSAEYMTTKNHPMLADCVVLYAGNDMQYAPLILADAANILSPTADPSEVAEAIDDAYHEQINRLIERQILRRYRFTSEKFSTQGKKLCTETIYNRLCERIGKVELSARFIICGFDKKKDGHIYTAGGEESIENFDHIGIWAIGKGAPAALSAMAFHVTHMHFSPMYDSLDAALYFALESKFMAESADTVGKSTFVTITETGKRVRFINEPDIDKIRNEWRKSGAPRRSTKVLQMIPRMIYDFGQEKPQ